MSDLSSVENEIAAKIERNELIDKNAYYKAKLPSIRQAQESGISDEDIEQAFNINILPEHRVKK